MPAGVERNSYNIGGDHLTGYSSVNNCFFAIILLLFFQLSGGCNNIK